MIHNEQDFQFFRGLSLNLSPTVCVEVVHFSSIPLLSPPPLLPLFCFLSYVVQPPVPTGDDGQLMPAHPMAYIVQMRYNRYSQKRRRPPDVRTNAVQLTLPIGDEIHWMSAGPSILWLRRMQYSCSSLQATTASWYPMLRPSKGIVHVQ